MFNFKYKMKIVLFTYDYSLQTWNDSGILKESWKFRKILK